MLVYSYARPEPVLITKSSREVVSLLLSYAFRLIKTSLSLKTDKLSLSLLLVNALRLAETDPKTAGKAGNEETHR